MKVLLVNTSDNTGGAAVAATRLMNALSHNGIDVRMMVRDRKTQDERVLRQPLPLWKRLLGCIVPGGSFSKAMERLLLLPKLNYDRTNMWAIDDATCGTDISHSKAFTEADVIHIHWVNQGMLSMADIRSIMLSGKRIVWTMHDLWNATSLCHYAGDCEAFRNAERPCSGCHLLPEKSRAYAEKAWKAKRETWLSGKDRLSFVTCSEWLGAEAKSSTMLQGFDVQAIPNPIDTALYRRTDKTAARQKLGLPENKRIILFVSQKVTDERKGAQFFIDAVNSLAAKRQDIGVAILGGNGEEVARQLKTGTSILGYITDQQTIVSVYNAADVFVLPSLQDNLPNTIMEAMACGVPCVGFDIGGIPEMIDHRMTGIIAPPRDTEALANGIAYCLDDENHDRLSEGCLMKVQKKYSEKAVAKAFTDLYSAK